MIRKNIDVKTFKKAAFICSAFLFFALTFSASAEQSHNPGKTLNNNKSLFEASLWEQTDKIAALIQGGADVNAVNETGQTPLMFAAQAAESIESDLALRFLIANGADVNLRDRSGKRALDYAEANEILKTPTFYDDYTYDLHGRFVSGYGGHSEPARAGPD